MRVAAVSNCERLGKYRMPFAWTAIHLVDIISGKQASTDTTATAAAATGPSQEKETTPAGTPARKVINPNVDKLHLLRWIPLKVHRVIRARKDFHKIYLKHSNILNTI